MRILFDDERKILFPEEIHGLFQDLEHEVNSFSFDPVAKTDKVCADTYEKCLWFYIALEWVRFHATEQVYEDGRNQIAMDKIRKVASLPGFTELYDFFFMGTSQPSFEAVAKEFVSYAPRLHRTLMQTETGFFLCLLDRVNEGIHQEMEEYEGDPWWSMPLI